MKRVARTLLVLAIGLAAASACGGSTHTSTGKGSNSLIQAVDTTIRARSFTVTVNTTGNLTYYATMHYNAPDRIDVFTQKGTATVESLSIGTTNYLSDGADPPHFFTSAPSPAPFSESVLEVLRNLKVARVSSSEGSRFQITEPGTQPTSGAVTVAGKFVTEVTLHFPTNTTVYKFSDFNSAPKIEPPDPSQVRTSTFPTLPGVPPLQKCNSDGSIPAGATICGK